MPLRVALYLVSLQSSRQLVELLSLQWKCSWERRQVIRGRENPRLKLTLPIYPLKIFQPELHLTGCGRVPEAHV